MGQAGLVEHLPNVKRPWDSFPGQNHGIMMVHACHPSMREAGAGQSEVEGHPPVHREFEASMSYMKHYFGKQEQKEIHVRFTELGASDPLPYVLCYTAQT